MREILARLDGVGRVSLLGASVYAMRVWLDPDWVEAAGRNAGDVVRALCSQNLQVGAGVMNQPPASGPKVFEVGVQTWGPLMRPEEFGDFVIRAMEGGRVLSLRDVARIELGARSHCTSGILGRQSAVALAIDQRTGTNALATASKLRATIERLALDFPEGMTCEIGYNPIDFVQALVDAVKVTIFEAMSLVVLFVILFLQNFQTALIPILEIPVSLVGTFAVMAAFIPMAFVSGITGQFFQQFALTIASATIISAIVSLP